MADNELDPGRFGAAFKAFMDAVVAAAVPPESPLLERIEAHLGVEPSQLPVISEEYDAFEHPNIQRAIDEYISRPGRRADLIGIGAENRRFMSLGLSDLLSFVGRAGRPELTEGPVDYVNVHLANDQILPCVQLGLYLIKDGTFHSWQWWLLRSSTVRARSCGSR
jgi:hypothetical protein